LLHALRVDRLGCEGSRLQSAEKVLTNEHLLLTETAESGVIYRYSSIAHNGRCCNYLSPWPWSTWRFQRCSRHTWLHDWDYGYWVVRLRAERYHQNLSNMLSAGSDIETCAVHQDT